ncbi:hypothetical protein [Faecalispora anaeroviscerum]|uniref:hypothetical protein n=1 Tax=Faecalispora anaeroviscerum TaxID=2991836 RepID=UPI0024B8FC2F|nr:hypothetical protein [Faecalispora anaeroviscerum]
MANDIEYSEVYQGFIDEELEAKSSTQWMVPNDDQIDYSGGKDVKIAQLSVSGLGNYNRTDANKYPAGSVKLGWKNYTMEMDRAVKFELGRLDPNDSHFMATSENVTREFARKQLVPEQDMFRFNRIYSKLSASDAYKTSHILRVAAADAATNVVSALKNLSVVVKDDSGDDADFVAFVSLKNEQAFRDESKNTNNSVTFQREISVNGVSYRGAILNDLPCIFVPSKRLQTVIKILDGRTSGQEAGGIIADSTSEQIEFLIMNSSAPVAVSKIDSLKVFSADENQTGDETTINYHLLYDLWVLENQISTLAACVRSKT